MKNLIFIFYSPKFFFFKLYLRPEAKKRLILKNRLKCQYQLCWPYHRAFFMISFWYFGCIKYPERQNIGKVTVSIHFNQVCLLLTINGNLNSIPKLETEGFQDQPLFLTYKLKTFRSNRKVLTKNTDILWRFPYNVLWEAFKPIFLRVIVQI